MNQDLYPGTDRLTETYNLFEDFAVGDVIRHPRGKTVTDVDGEFIANLVMNTSHGHFNEHAMLSSEFGSRLLFGGITASLVVGLASQDTSENAIEELTVDEVNLPVPVRHGDSLYAFTRVLEVRPESDTTGVVRFEHFGVNQDDAIVCRVIRTVRLPRRAGA